MGEAKTHYKNSTITIIIVLLLVSTGATVGVLQAVTRSGNTHTARVAGSTVRASGDVTFTAQAGKSVLAQLQDRAKVVTKKSSYGAYVASINGKASGNDGKYWTFYVNGKVASKNAAEYITNGGEKIQWKFE